MSNKRNNTRRKFNKPKGRKNDFERSEEMKQRESTRQNSSNNPNWYIPNDGMVVGAYLPFNQAAGTPIDYSDNLNGGQLDISGVATLRIIPTLGLSQSATSPISNAMVKLWTDVRRNKSSYSPYDAASLMMYVRAMADVYSYIVYLQRVYGIASSMYAQGNRFMPKVLLEANCVDPDISAQDLAQFRYGINRLITQAASFNVPATLPIFQRAAFMYQNIYTEGSSIKDQLYMYVPEGFMRLMWNDDPGDPDDRNIAVYLKMEPFYHDGASNKKTYTMEELITYGDNLMVNLIGDEDVNMMGADILAAYGPENMVKLSMLPEYYPLVPLFDIAVLEQMKNARPVFIPTANLVDCIAQGRYDVTQPAGSYLLSQPPVAAAAYTLQVTPNNNSYVLNDIMRNLILTTTTGNVTPELVMESSRLLYAVDSAEIYSGAYFVGPCGSELVAGVDMWNINSFGRSYVTSYIEADVFDTTDESFNINATLATIADHSRYDFLPAYQTIYSTSESLHYSEIYFDVDNFTLLHKADVKRLHEMALLTLFGVNKF